MSKDRRGPKRPKRTFGNYDTGYGKPPDAYKFKPGQSGNPGGRKKGTKNVATQLAQVFSRKVEIREKGQTRTGSILEAATLKMLQRALDGDPKAFRIMLDLYEIVFRDQQRRGYRESVPKITGKMTLEEATAAYAELLRRDHEDGEGDA